MGGSSKPLRCTLNPESRGVRGPGKTICVPNNQGLLVPVSVALLSSLERQLDVLKREAREACVIT